MSLQGRDLLRLLRQADQKVAAMDKMHFYVCQTDANMSYYLAKAVTDSSRCTHKETLRLMNACAQDMDDEAGNGNKEDVNDNDKYSLVEDDLNKEMSSNEEESENDAEDEDDDSRCCIYDGCNWGRSQTVTART